MIVDVVVHRCCDVDYNETIMCIIDTPLSHQILADN